MVWVASLRARLEESGWVRLPGSGEPCEYRSVVAQLGDIVGEEVIALRPGAHAYVAKPGPVPLHTDHPEAAFVCWFCEQQDEQDGASLLLDSRPIVEALPSDLCEALHSVDLWCPPLCGGPPTLRYPVLWRRDGKERVFCSPWLRAASQLQVHQEALDEFRARVSNAARRGTVEVRLSPGDLLVVDNSRVLHGRRAIMPESARRLRRLWVGDADVRGRRIPDPEWTSRPLSTVHAHSAPRELLAMHELTTAHIRER